MEWKIYRIGQICKRFSSGKFVSADSISTHGKYPVYGGNGMRGFTSISNFDGECSIIGRQGAYCGNVRYFKGKGYMTDHAIVAVTNEEHCNRFFSYKLSLANLGRFSGQAAQPGLSVTKLTNLRLEMPSLPIQRRIASILSSYDNLIETNNRRIKLLEQMAENIYKEWFVRFRFPGYEKYKIINGLPEGWKIERLGNVSDICTGKCNREDAEEDGEYPLFDRSQETKKSSQWLKDCQAIIVPGEGTSFMPRYYWGKFNLHQRCYCVEPKDDKMGKYLFYTLKENKSYFLSVATGATVPSLRYNNFAYMKFVQPQKEIYTQYDDIVTSIFSQINTLQSQNANLARQRDMLLPRLMSGKIELK